MSDMPTIIVVLTSPCLGEKCPFECTPIERVVLPMVDAERPTDDGDVPDIPPQVEFPTQLDPDPIIAFAANLLRCSIALRQGAEQLVDTGKYASSTWRGDASKAFIGQANVRALRMMSVGSTIEPAPDALLRYATTITEAHAIHEDATDVYCAALGELPDAEPALRQAAAAQREAVTIAEQAAHRCAGVLDAVRRSVLDQMLPFGMLRPRFPGLYEHSPTGPQFRRAPLITMPPPAELEPAEALTRAKYLYKFGLWSAESYEKWLHANNLALEHVIGERGTTYIRNGKEVRRWKPGLGMTNKYGTLRQMEARLAAAEARLKAFKIGNKVGNVLGLALAGSVQYLEDRDNPNLTGDQRFARVAAATALEGGGAWLGFLAGFKLGGAAFVWAGGVGAIPGAIVGGLVGAGVSLLMGWLGKKAKEKLFDVDPYRFGVPADRIAVPRPEINYEPYEQSLNPTMAYP